MSMDASGFGLDVARIYAEQAASGEQPRGPVVHWCAGFTATDVVTGCGLRLRCGPARKDDCGVLAQTTCPACLKAGGR